MAKHKFDPTQERAKVRGRTNPTKSRVLGFPKIKYALAQGEFGTIFTTPQSDDIYVITHGSWGEKSGNKVVKSFPPDTPYAEIKGFSERTKTKHGGKKVRAGSKGKSEAGFATKEDKNTTKQH